MADLFFFSTRTDYFLRSLADRNDWLTYQLADFKSEQGRSIPYLYLSTSSQPQGSSVDAASSNSTDSSKVRAYIQGAIHGNEPAGDQGLLALLGKMDANATWAASVLEKIDVLVIPRYNPDGVHYFQRELASNVDPNREHTKLMRQQSRDIKKLITPFEPHLVVDMHEYAGHNVFGGLYRHGQDAMIASGNNLNTHREIRALASDMFVSGIGEALEARGFRWEPYVTGPPGEVGDPIVLEEAVTSPTSGRNAFGLGQAVAVLCELRGQYLADQHFQRRTASSLTMLEAVLDIASSNAEEIVSTVERSIDEYIRSDEDMILTDYQESENRTFTMVDVRNGSLVQAPVEFLSSSPAVANLTRSRPEAYLIPRNLGDLAERLEIMGVEVERLSHEWRGPVQSYNITSSRLEDEYYEGVVRNSVTTEPLRKEDLHLPPGSFRVSARHKNAALAFVTLEPESAVSFVTFGLLPVSTGYEYPVFRVVSSWS